MDQADYAAIGAANGIEVQIRRAVANAQAQGWTEVEVRLCRADRDTLLRSPTHRPRRDAHVVGSDDLAQSHVTGRVDGAETSQPLSDMQAETETHQNSMFICRQGLLCDIEGHWMPAFAERVRGEQDIFQIGDHRYGRKFEPLTPGAPKILDAWDLTSNWKQHKRGRDAKLDAVMKRIEAGKKAEEERMFLAGPDGWKAKPLTQLPRHKFLRVACKKCTRVRLDSIGHLVGEGRQGTVTVLKLEQIERCYGCRWDVTISLAD